MCVKWTNNLFPFISETNEVWYNNKTTYISYLKDVTFLILYQIHTYAFLSPDKCILYTPMFYKITLLFVYLFSQRHYQYNQVVIQNFLTNVSGWIWSIAIYFFCYLHWWTNLDCVFIKTELRVGTDNNIGILLIENTKQLCSQGILLK